MLLYRCKEEIPRKWRGGNMTIKTQYHGTITCW
nr:MAG TPA: hypothetical protein [Caudoviricetes sp.]